ncbi:MAG TPA: GNAT family N-acetyltransferase [Chroococcidiopsis sp.]
MIHPPTHSSTHTPTHSPIRAPIRPPLAVIIRAATADEDGIVGRHFYQMWLDNGVPAAAITADWSDRIQQFIDHARQSLGYQAFLAEVQGVVVGSAGCQRFAGLYSPILQDSERCDGYIWGVYVEPAYRRHGIATQLTEQAIAYLRLSGCTRAVLNAAPMGKPVYERLGFAPANVMELPLS